MRFDRVWIIASVIAVILVSLVCLWLSLEIAFGADVDNSCMTKAQAAAKYPGQWLYWHGPRHCWDNHSGRFSSRAGVYGKTNSLKLPRPPLDANANVTHHSGRPIILAEQTSAQVPTIMYPALMSGGGTDDTMLQPQAMVEWPLIIDIDVDPPQFIPWQRRISSAFVAPVNGGEPDLIATTHEETR
jgi:hypothetical protein